MDEKEMPLDGEKWSPDPVWGKMGEWTKYKQSAEWDDAKKDSPVAEDDYVRGCLVFYIDVGSLPPFKAEAFIERMKDALNDRGGLTRIKKHQEVFFVPVRNGNGTR